MLSKPAEQITAGDIESLIESEVPEGEQIEFKEKPSAKKGAVDPWMLGKGRIGDRGRDELLEEVVAFANAYGGTLLLGVKESKAKPPVAAEITSVPRCAELAERLKLVFRDCAEPEIPRIEIFAVQTKDDSGVVVFRVGRSRMAPHRVTTTRVCPVRRADRCEGMSMREIQDMTLNVSRGLERLERRLSERSERFSQEFDRLEPPEDAFGIRLTAAPVGEEIRFDRVIHQRRLVEGLEAHWCAVSVREGFNRRTLATPVDGLYSWRPMLRAARAQTPPSFRLWDANCNCYQEIHCDGVIELGFVIGVSHAQNKYKLGVYVDYPPVLFANLIVRAQRARRQAGVPVAEYAIEAETYARGRGAGPTSPPELYVPEDTSSIGATKFPRYSLGGRDEIPNLLNVFYRDFSNHLGRDIGDEEDSLTIQGWPSEG